MTRPATRYSTSTAAGHWAGGPFRQGIGGYAVAGLGDYMWVPWRRGNPEQQARQRRAGGRAVRGVQTSKAAIAAARKKHRRQALKQLRAGKLTPKQYQKRLKEIG